MENSFVDRDRYFATDFNYTTPSFRQWVPATSPTNDLAIGTGAMSPSTISSTGVSTPFEYGEWYTFDESFARALGQPEYPRGTSMNVPRVLDSPQNLAFGTSSSFVTFWQPWEASQANTYLPLSREENNALPKAEGVELEKLYDSEQWQRPIVPPPRKELESACDSGVIERACSRTPKAEEVFPKMEYLPDIHDPAPPQPQQKPWPNQTDRRTPQIQTTRSRRETSTTSTTTRTIHNDVEKKYRTRLNSHFKALLAKIPTDVLSANGIETACADGGRKNITKADTLVLAKQYIGILKREERMLAAENRALLEEMARLNGQWKEVGGLVMP